MTIHQEKVCSLMIFSQKAHVCATKKGTIKTLLYIKRLSLLEDPIRSHIRIWILNRLFYPFVPFVVEVHPFCFSFYVFLPFRSQLFTPLCYMSYPFSFPRVHTQYQMIDQRVDMSVQNDIRPSYICIYFYEHFSSNTTLYFCRIYYLEWN